MCGVGFGTTLLAKTIVAWKTEKSLIPGTRLNQQVVPWLRPGMRLRAAVYSRSSPPQLVSCQECTVEQVDFMDIALQSMLGSNADPTQTGPCAK